MKYLNELKSKTGPERKNLQLCLKILVHAESAYVKVLITKLRSNLCCTYYILKHAKVLKLDSDM